MQIDKPLRLLLLGKAGQLGQTLLHSLNACGAVEAHDRHSCDLSNESELRRIVRNSRADIVVNAAAYTNVDRAEAERDICLAVNAYAPRIMAQEAAAIGASLIHYSTDYVFDGRKQSPYTETDAPRPLNVYGDTKALGERAALEESDQTAILRLSWVYGFAGRNFPRTVLQLARERDEIEVVSDQVGAPTFTGLVADVTTSYIRHLGRHPRDSSHYGIFHLAPRGRTSWYDYAVMVVAIARDSGLRLRLDERHILPVKSGHHPGKALRPLNSSFDTSKLSGLLELELPTWDRDVRPFVQKMVRADDRS